MLAKEERLAGLTTELAADGSTLTAKIRNQVVLSVDLDTPGGRSELESFFGRMLDCSNGELPVLAEEVGRRFTDVSVRSDTTMNAVSIINTGSVTSFAEEVGTWIDPLRFRANIYIEGLEAFAENELVGKHFTIGECTFAGVLQTRRCAATEVNPATAARDLPIPRLLMQKYGEDHMGIYAEVVVGGRLAAGDYLRICPPDGNGG
jgi:uncharacterized protein